MQRTSVGVDLAWGDRASSGVAVLRDGAIVASATVRTDDEVCALVPGGPVVVAFDAPIVVRNPTGRRPCDAAISRCFARFHAGAYPANRSIPWLADPRAGRLAARLGLDLDVGAPADRVALEVYPHAALVVLLGLDRVLPYKRRRGRDLALRRAAMERLCDGLEGLAGASPPTNVRAGPRWQDLRDAVARADSLAALDRVEDELDAHVCAHVAAQWDADPARCDVVGDAVADGAIVVPASRRTSPCLTGAA